MNGATSNTHLKGVVVRVPAKVNLQLSVGPLGPDGFHEVVTVFQAVSIFDDVTVKFAAAGSGINLSVSGSTTQGVPTDSSNGWRKRRCWRSNCCNRCFV